MYVVKTLGFKKVIQFTGHHIVWIATWMTTVVLVYRYAKLSWLVVPWLPLSIVGTAVAFYLGFKNNSAYARMWEARKIWGAIVNSSRSWGMYVNSFISNQFATQALSPQQLHEIKKALIYRHIGWLYTLRQQLLVVTPWEHANQSGLVGKQGRMYRKTTGVGLVEEEHNQSTLDNFVSAEEQQRMSQYANPATQLINQQATELADLQQKGLTDHFRHVELQAILKDFYTQQGKCERIKKFPLPRQYNNMSLTFVGIFILLLPFGMISEFSKLGELGIWLSIPFGTLVSWVYIVMELVGEYSENPFQGMANDIPMLSLCRTIEIDLREMLGETDLPAPIEAKKGILM
ncbi:bestrophin family protein [uncultured Microscilla sp.]|uniref:bestrophin family protein n=1 Tax=uncultured Microscilla sp. TaxID=432653 RepID=UPI00260A2B7A|nr:bestrophin family ion channel [uncultured Microscilla sp.]